MPTEIIDTSIDRICKDCGQAFILSDEARQFYQRKGLQLPKRCIPCRDEKRRRNEATQ